MTIYAAKQMDRGVSTDSTQSVLMLATVSTDSTQSVLMLATFYLVIETSFARLMLTKVTTITKIDIKYLVI